MNNLTKALYKTVEILKQDIVTLKESKASLEMTVSMQSAMIDEYKKKNADLIREIAKLENTVDRLNEELC